jgi:hypothetical protein
VNAMNPVDAANADMAQLLATADRLLADAVPSMAAGRYRGAAFALRTALETALGDVLLAGPYGIRDTSTRAKLLCLRGCTDAETARRARGVWVLLCLGCHYHQYEIGPSKDEVLAWQAEAVAVIDQLRV